MEQALKDFLALIISLNLPQAVALVIAFKLIIDYQDRRGDAKREEMTLTLEAKREEGRQKEAESRREGEKEHTAALNRLATAIETIVTDSKRRDELDAQRDTRAAAQAEKQVTKEDLQVHDRAAATRAEATAFAVNTRMDEMREELSTAEAETRKQISATAELVERNLSKMVSEQTERIAHELQAISTKLSTVEQLTAALGAQVKEDAKPQADAIQTIQSQLDEQGRGMRQSLEDLRRDVQRLKTGTKDLPPLPPGLEPPAPANSGDVPNGVATTPLPLPSLPSPAAPAPSPAPAPPVLSVSASVTMPAIESGKSTDQDKERKESA